MFEAVTDGGREARSRLTLRLPDPEEVTLLTKLGIKELSDRPTREVASVLVVAQSRPLDADGPRYVSCRTITAR